MSRKDRLSSAIDTLARKLENGHLLAASDSAEFLTAAASEIDRLTRELAEAKALAVIPDGWVAVPENPTTAMHEEGHEALMNSLQLGMVGSAALRIYRSMLSARPELPKESENA